MPTCLCEHTCRESVTCTYVVRNFAKLSQQEFDVRLALICCDFNGNETNRSIYDIYNSANNHKYDQSTPLILGPYFRKGETKDDLTKAMSNSSSAEYSIIDLS